jgi:hypothetical protein
MSPKAGETPERVTAAFGDLRQRGGAGGRPVQLERAPGAGVEERQRRRPEREAARLALADRHRGRHPRLDGAVAGV